MQGILEPDGAIAYEPVHRFNGILDDFSSLPVYRNEIELRRGVAMVCGGPVYARRLCRILDDANSVFGNTTGIVTGQRRCSGLQ